MNPSSRFGDVIREARLAQGLAPDTLAGLAGWTTEQIADAEAHRFIPGTDQLFRLAVFLGLEPEALARLAIDGPRPAGPESP